MRHIAQSILIVITMLLMQCCLAGANVITVDPNTAEARAVVDVDSTDTRLAKKISYECKSKPTREIVDELSEMTGVYLISGKNRSDWQVRDAKMTIFVKDVSLAELMNSMARVMRFRWSRSGEGPEWRYRMLDDDEAVRKVEARLHSIEQEIRQARIQTLKQIETVARLSSEELSKLKESNPYLYFWGKTGTAKTLMTLFSHIPQLKSAIIDNTDLDLKARDLPAGTRDAILQYVKTSLNTADMRQSLPEDVLQDPGSLSIRVKRYPESVTMSRYSRGMLGYFSIGCSTDAGLSGMSLEDPNLERVQVYYKYYIKDLEDGPDNSPWNDISVKDSKIMYAFIRDGNLEPLIENAINPELLKKVTIKKSDIRDEIINQVSREIDLNIVVDSYCIWQKRHIEIDVKDAELVKVIEQLCLSNRFNWEQHSSIFEISDRQWYIVRKCEIPDALMDRWHAEVKQTGTLDLGSLSEIALLTDDQLHANMGSDDDVLSNYHLERQIRRSGEYLRVYASLTKNQRSMLLSQRGLGIANLSPAQQQAIYKLMAGVDLPKDFPDLKASGIDLRMTASRVQDFKRFIYTISGSLNGLPIPGQYILSTPIYHKYPEDKSQDSDQKEQK